MSHDHTISGNGVNNKDSNDADKKQEAAKLLKLYKLLTKRVIAFNPIYAEIAKSVTSGLLLSQLSFHAEHFADQWFYKTDKTLREETKIGKHELANAKANLTNLGVISIERRGFPAKTNYKVNIHKIIELALEKDVLSFPETGNPVSRKPGTQFPGFREPDYIEDILKDKQHDTPTEGAKNALSVPSEDEVVVGLKLRMNKSAASDGVQVTSENVNRALLSHDREYVYAQVAYVEKNARSNPKKLFLDACAKNYASHSKIQDRSNVSPIKSAKFFTSDENKAYWLALPDVQKQVLLEKAILRSPSIEWEMEKKKVSYLDPTFTEFCYFPSIMEINGRMIDDKLKY